MNMFDEARAIRGTMELCSLTQREMAERLKVSQSYVANKLRLLSLPSELEKLIIEGNLSERHARAVLRLPDNKQRKLILEKCRERGLTVRECEALVEAEVDLAAPVSISRADELDRIDTFLSTLRRSVERLCFFGVSAEIKTGYLGNKMFVTVCIENC